MAEIDWIIHFIGNGVFCPDCGKIENGFPQYICNTVREWLSSFDIQLEDEAFVRWHQTVAQFSAKIRELEQKHDPITMMQVWFVIRSVMYLMYDTTKDFMPQFEYNAENMLGLLEDIPTLKRMVRNAG